VLLQFVFSNVLQEAFIEVEAWPFIEVEAWRRREPQSPACYSLTQ